MNILDYRNNSLFINDLEGLEKYFRDNAINSSERVKILMEVYDYNNKVYYELNKENQMYLKIVRKKQISKELLVDRITRLKEEVTLDGIVNDDSLKIDVSFYLELINTINNIEEIGDILPLENSADYDNIINMILVNLLKEETIVKMILKDMDVDDNDYDYYYQEYVLIHNKINYIKNYRYHTVEEAEILLDFMNDDNKYKILFSGLAYKDISMLEKNIKKALIKKLSDQLSKNDIITLSEAVDHVKDLTGFPLSRVQFADDYRIAYTRKDNVTVILGVALKTGKPIDYTRYDAIAKRGDLIYKEVELFNQNLLPKDSTHFKTIELLEEFQRNNTKKK